MPSEPVFIPKPGQTDYTNIRWAPVVNCAVRYQGKILLVQRSPNMRLYPEYWNGISGFLDDAKSLEEKVQEELHEELGLDASHITSIYLGQIFDQEAPEHQKTWIVHPVLVDIDTDAVKLDWEASRYEWLSPEHAKSLKLLPGFEKVLRNLELK